MGYHSLSPGDLSYPGIKPGSPACRQILYHVESPGKTHLYLRESIGIDGVAIREATLVTQLVQNPPTMQETPV